MPIRSSSRDYHPKLPPRRVEDGVSCILLGSSLTMEALTVIRVVAPWGRLVPGRKELMEPEIGVKFWNWTEKQIEEYF